MLITRHTVEIYSVMKDEKLSTVRCIKAEANQNDASFIPAARIKFEQVYSFYASHGWRRNSFYCNRLSWQ